MALSFLRLAFFSLTLGTAQATTFYVATTGFDQNPGTEASPWATVSKACGASAVKPGDTITVKPGVYHEKVAVTRFGSENAFVTLQGEPGAILDGTGVEGESMILLENPSWIRISSFEIRNNAGVTDGGGIRATGGGSHIEILGNTIHDMRGENAMGITFYGDAKTSLSDIVIADNTIFDCEPAPSETIVLNGNVEKFRVEGNTIRDVNNIGIDFIGGEGVCPVAKNDVARDGLCAGNRVERAKSTYEDGYAAGIYVDGGKNIVLDGNYVAESDIGLEVGAENRSRTVTGVIVRNNVLCRNEKAGLGFGGYASKTGRVTNCRFHNNTIVENQTHPSETQADLWIQYASKNVVEDNIFVSSAGKFLVLGEKGGINNTLRNNLYFRPGGAQAAKFLWAGKELSGFAAFQKASKETGGRFADPLLPGAGDFHLQAGSPAIDASEAFAESRDTDFYGNPRQRGPGVDLGAVEAASPAGGLTVSGKDILLNGQAVRLRGVAVGDAILARGERPHSDYRTIAKDWKANIVRVGIHPTVWKHPEKYSPDGKDGIVAALRSQVHAALAAGMAVIIDWHVIGWPNGYYEPVQPEWESPEDLYDSDFALAQDFWDRMAQEFAAQPRVAFELWNEPVSADGIEKNSRWAELKPFWQTLTETIRARAGNLIIAAGDSWAYDLRGVKASPLPDANTAYAWHIYAGHSENDEAEWAKSLDELQEVKPVIAAEWGFERNSKEHFRGTPQNFGIKFRDHFLEGRKLHSTAWCWHPDWTPCLLRANWKTPTEFGTFVKKYLSGK